MLDQAEGFAAIGAQEVEDAVAAQDSQVVCRDARLAGVYKLPVYVADGHAGSIHYLPQRHGIKCRLVVGKVRHRVTVLWVRASRWLAPFLRARLLE